MNSDDTIGTLLVPSIRGYIHYAPYLLLHCNTWFSGQVENIGHRLLVHNSAFVG